MATIGEIANGLAATAGTIRDLEAHSYPPDSVNAPAVFVSSIEVVEGTFGFGSMELTADLIVVLSHAAAKAAYTRLFELMSQEDDSSMWAVLAANSDLGLAGTNARVTVCRTLGDIEIGGINYVGGLFEVAVTTPT
jgi:hypothetical protein